MSECVGICQMDDNQEYCLGCGRSAAQIFGDEEETAAPSATASAAMPTDAAATAPTPPAA